MSIIKRIWKKITHTLDEASGKLEIAFFEDVYRVAFATGLSLTDDTIAYLIYSTAVKVMLTLLICGEVWYLYSEPLGMDEAAAFLNAVDIQIITMYKLKIMIKHKDIYKKLAQSMETSYFDMSTKERQELVKFWSNKESKYVKALLYLGNCTLAAWRLYPFVDELDYNLMISLHLPFRYDTPLSYSFTYVIVGIAFLFVSHSAMVADLVPLICQLSVLADCFEIIVHDCSRGIDVRGSELTSNNDFVRKYLTRLGNLVEQHKLILNYSVDFRVILSGPLLGQLAASGTLICFVGYQATTALVENITKCLMNLLYLGYSLFSLYCLSVVRGNNCAEFRVGEAAYCSGWQAGLSVLPGVKSTITMVIARANKLLFFTAGGMYNLSLYPLLSW